MAANVEPIFVDTPLGDVVQISTANTNRDGTGTLGTLTTAAADGTRIDGIIAKATVTTTAGMVRIYYDNTSAVRLIGELVVAAITVGASTKAWEGVWRPVEPILLPSGHIIKLSTHNAEAINCLALGGDF